MSVHTGMLKMMALNMTSILSDHLVLTAATKERPSQVILATESFPRWGGWGQVAPSMESDKPLAAPS